MRWNKCGNGDAYLDCDYDQAEQGCTNYIIKYHPQLSFDIDLEDKKHAVFDLKKKKKKKKTATTV